MYENMTPEKIKADIMANLTEMGSDLSVVEGDFADTQAGPLAVEISKYYNAFNAVIPIVWVNDDSGQYLDLAAEALGIVPRKEGSPARVVLKITGKPDYKIPKGTACVADNEETLYFDLENDAVIPPSGTILVFALAREYGAKYNVPANTIINQFTNSASIETVNNPEAAIGGSDVESDTSLYNRIVLERQKPSTSGNKYDYEKWALEVAGVGYAVVIPLWNGNGTVKVIIADDNRQPVDDEIVRKCLLHIEDVRPIGATVTVVSAVAKAINISAILELDDNLDLTIDESTYREDIQGKVVKALESQFSQMALKYNEVIYNWIGAVIIGTDGVQDYTNLLVNGSTADILLQEGEIPSVGEVVLT